MSNDASKSPRNGESAEALFMIAEELAEAEKYDQALTTYDQVIAEFSNSPETSIRETVIRALTRACSDHLYA
jgi:TolA-binding protein